MKKLFLLLISGVLILCSACSNSAMQSTGKELNDSLNSLKDADNKYVLMVRGGYKVDNPDLTYEKAFDDFFGTPRWHYFESETGENVVEFTGDCMYQDVSVKARIQFVIDEDNGTFEATSLAFNEVPQNFLTMNALFEVIFESDELEVEGDIIEQDDFSETEWEEYDEQWENEQDE